MWKREKRRSRALNGVSHDMRNWTNVSPFKLKRIRFAMKRCCQAHTLTKMLHRNKRKYWALWVLGWNQFHFKYVFYILVGYFSFNFRIEWEIHRFLLRLCVDFFLPPPFFSAFIINIMRKILTFFTHCLTN